MNQNAIQTKCLFLHLPFIMHKYKSERELKKLWTCYQSLSKMCQIAYSPEIHETDVENFERESVIYLTTYQSVFDDDFTPKQHLITHYATFIRRMGSVAFLNMFRSESKC